MCKDLNLVTAVLKETVIFLSTLQDKKLSVYDQAAKPSVENRNKCLDFFCTEAAVIETRRFLFEQQVLRKKI